MATIVASVVNLAMMVLGSLEKNPARLSNMPVKFALKLVILGVSVGVRSLLLGMLSESAECE